MADDREIVVGSLIILACSLGAAILLLKKTLRVGEKVTSVRENSMENVTLFYRNLLLWKW